MKTIFKTIFFCLAIISTTILNAQEFQGQAVYQAKTTMDMNFGGREMSEEQKKRIAERMKSFLEKTYVLTFNKEASTYKEDEQLEAPGQRGGFGRMMMGSFTPGEHYKNIKTKNQLQEQEFFGKQFLITDSLAKLDWKLTGETKQIGQYTCFKATAVKKIDDLDWRSMRRKRRERENQAKKQDTIVKKTDSLKAKAKSFFDTIDMPKETTITAWYTMQIPISQGPADYWGLPGLILEINADRTTILCTKVVMNPKEKQSIEAPTKGKEVTRAEYKQIVIKKMEEMMDMYGGRGRRGGFRGRG